MPVIRLLAEQVASQIDIVFVYILEAHACDEWKLGTKYQIPQHKSLEDRLAAVKQMKQELEFPDNIKVFCDSMNNEFDHMYSCWPDRHLLIENEIALVASTPSNYGYSRIDILEYLLRNVESLGISKEAEQLLSNMRVQLH